MEYANAKKQNMERKGLEKAIVGTVEDKRGDEEQIKR